MKVIHLASVKKASANQGVVRQMEWEQLAAIEAGLQWDVELWSTDPALPGSVLRQVPRRLSGFLGRRFHYHRRIRQAAKSHDVVIIRHAPMDPFGFFIPERVRKKTWYVFHTHSDHYLRSRGGRLGWLFAMLDRWFTRRAVGRSAGIIGVTDELVEHERNRLGRPNNKSFVYPNGLYLDDWDSPLPDKRDGQLKIIFIASRFFDWNGLESLLSSIKNYSGDEAWELHLVGRLLPHQEAFIVENDLGDRIVRHDVMHPNEIQQLLQSMDLSLGAFAMEKVHVKTACTLKVRESLSAGVPVYAGHSDVGVSGFPECYQEGPPNWARIVQAAKIARLKQKTEVRNIAQAGIDKVSLVERLIAFFHSDQRMINGR